MGSIERRPKRFIGQCCSPMKRRRAEVLIGTGQHLLTAIGQCANGAVADESCMMHKSVAHTNMAGKGVDCDQHRECHHGQCFSIAGRCKQCCALRPKMSSASCYSQLCCE